MQSLPLDSGEVLAVRVPEAARRVGVSRSVIYQHIADGRLPSFKLGNCRLISLPALSTWLGEFASSNSSMMTHNQDDSGKNS